MNTFNRVFYILPDYTFFFNECCSATVTVLFGSSVFYYLLVIMESILCLFIKDLQAIANRHGKKQCLEDTYQMLPHEGSTLNLNCYSSFTLGWKLGENHAGLTIQSIFPSSCHQINLSYMLLYYVLRSWTTVHGT